MERNLDLIRHLMLEIEEKETPGEYTLRYLPEAIKGFEKKYGSDYEQVRNKHLYMLIEAKFIEGKYFKDNANNYTVIPIRITWEGHNYIDSIKNNDVWSEVKSKLKTIGGFTLPIVQQVAASILTNKLGF